MELIDYFQWVVAYVSDLIWSKDVNLYNKLDHFMDFRNLCTFELTHNLSNILRTFDSRILRVRVELIFFSSDNLDNIISFLL